MNDESSSVPGELLTGPPSTGWVVHEVVRSKDADPIVWAWCKVGVDEPGYSEVTFTRPDGSTSVDAPADELRLGTVLFQLWC